MSEEFRPIRITLSEEAFDNMEKIMRDAAFRSYSSTIEECVRAIYDIIREIHTVAGERDSPEITATAVDQVNSLTRIIMRMNRFTGRTLVPTGE